MAWSSSDLHRFWRKDRGGNLGKVTCDEGAAQSEDRGWRVEDGGGEVEERADAAEEEISTVVDRRYRGEERTGEAEDGTPAVEDGGLRVEDGAEDGARLRGQVRSQVQLGNEGNGGERSGPRG